jgi:hypothetical protein
MTSGPRLITSFTDFERAYGGLEPLQAPTDADERLPYTAHAARAFFMNGGQRLYISRVFTPRDPDPNTGDLGVAKLAVQVAGGPTWRARWPGRFGNVWVETQVTRTKNIAYQAAGFGNSAITQAQRAKKGAIVEIVRSGAPSIPVGNADLVLANLAEVDIDPTDGRQIFLNGNDGAGHRTQIAPLAPDDIIQLVELRVGPQALHRKDPAARRPGR